MLDEEFLKDYDQMNKTLFSYLTIDKMIQMANFLINEPDFEDSHERCFKLPYLACEVFTRDNWLIPTSLFNEQCLEIVEFKYDVRQLKQLVAKKQSDFFLLDHLFSFYAAPSPYLNADSATTQLNLTLGGYLNKVFGFWLIKRPDLFLTFLDQKPAVI